MDRVRLAARNRMLAAVTYHDVTRVVEPYSIRVKGPGNTLLYVHEVTRGSLPTNQTKPYIIAEIQSARILEQPFTPQYEVEL